MTEKRRAKRKKKGVTRGGRLLKTIFCRGIWIESGEGEETQKKMEKSPLE